MINSMYSGVSGVQAHQEKMNVVSNNIVNVNTNGFKASRVVMTDSFSDTLQAASAGTATIGGRNPMQSGLGVTVGTIDVDTSYNTPTSTGRTLDAAINGDGYFEFKDNSGDTVYSRVGNFDVDPTTGLLTDGVTGYQVLDSTGAAITIPANSKFKSIDQQGNIIATDNTTDVESTVATLGIANFANNQGLEKLGSGMYNETANSGAALSADDKVAGNNGTGLLKTGCLEMSNVDLAKEFTEMITAQRGYQACSRVITTSDTLLEELINLKRN